jgi:2-amino-4-hydroxy-6-hydroxymethyldihydropteridine diphosphokinase
MALKQVYLSLGSNMGDREQNLSLALQFLEQAGVRVAARSSLYETAPQDIIDQPWFLNMAVRAETSLFPLQLLTLLHRIERELGRFRGQDVIRRGPRTIDIDILLYGSVRMETPQLVIPHPRMTQRRFVLEPLLEITPHLSHPRSKQRLSSYLKDVAGQNVRKLTPR